jgi:hypothetical protein
MKITLKTDKNVDGHKGKLCRPHLLNFTTPSHAHEDELKPTPHLVYCVPEYIVNIRIWRILYELTNYINN